MTWVEWAMMPFVILIAAIHILFILDELGVIKLKPIIIPESNAVFVMDGCGDLPAVKAHDPETGASYVVSAWEIPPDELKKLNETGILYVSVMGNGIQPISISVENPLKLAETDEERGDS